VHSPLEHTAPWKRDDLTPEDLYRDDTALLWEEVHALIVLGVGGGSLGVGQELVWAGDQLVPLLYLHSASQDLSRQVLGMALERDLTVKAYKSPDHLGEIVRRWVADRRARIVDGPRRRRDRALLLEPLRTEIALAWDGLSQPAKRKRALEMCLPQVRVERLADSALALAAAPLHEVLTVAGVLGVVGAARLLGAGGLPDLVSRQRDALASAAIEREWTVPFALELEQVARLELARGGVRRLSFGSIADWVRFAEDRGH
jgi:hypothetical protein